jgi:hypothetical protein
MLCLSEGPSSITTEIPNSCSPPHLLQETETLYWARDFFAVVVGTVLCIVGFDCIKGAVLNRALSEDKIQTDDVSGFQFYD